MWLVKMLLRLFKNFLTKGRLLKQWNATAISLIPKKEGADKVKDFRPISLCNVIYKVISKLIARRIQDILPLMISNIQSAFVKGRLLVENVLLATEMVQGFNQKRISKRGLLKVDLRKAFDTVSWEFILSTLRAADFPPTFTNWISQCLTSTSFSIMVNGDMCGNFQGTRGLRQGDPLSPALFVIAMEVFGNLLDSKVDAGLIGLHPKGRNPKISHLAFADDVMIFFDGKTLSLHNISEALQEFQNLSGLAMNKEKSALYTADLNPMETTLISSFGFQSGSLPFRYLRLPLMHRKIRISEFSPLMDSLL
ncbi:Secreted RxLR effector protein 78 [Cardamine amara subsp. amara]|uniref:Secreted RxLR effector protein 78 n=1 Tax=Cardamine amara subsp. amara TaxID=228776 RepID=A0ABD0ZCH5_CARAN